MNLARSERKPCPVHQVSLDSIAWRYLPQPKLHYLQWTLSTSATTGNDSVGNPPNCQLNWCHNSPFDRILDPLREFGRSQISIWLELMVAWSQGSLFSCSGGRKSSRCWDFVSRKAKACMFRPRIRWGGVNFTYRSVTKSGLKVLKQTFPLSNSSTSKMSVGLQTVH